MISSLSQREKIFVVGGGICVALVLLWFGVLAPYHAAVERHEARIASRQKQLQDIQELRREYLTLKKELETSERRLGNAALDFSLFSFLEEVTTRSGVRDRLVSMRPQNTSTRGEYREESVEMRLERLELPQLVKLLHALEQADAFLTTRSLRIKSRFDDRSRFDTVLVISSYQRAS
jgi:general secretion pathway protein M